MPGDELLHDIASGLADGLGYAVIARRLRRPTSTISREVLRNGGYDGSVAGYERLGSDSEHGIPLVALRLR